MILSFRYAELTINNLPKKKALSSVSFTVDFYKTFKKEIIPVLYKLLQQIEAEGIFFNSFYETSIILIQITYSIYKKVQTNIAHEQTQKSSVKYEKPEYSNVLN